MVSTESTTEKDPQRQRSTDVAGFLRLLHDEGSVYEVRIFDTAEPPGRSSFRRTAAGYFRGFAESPKWIDAYGGMKPPGIYCTLNSVEPSLFARSVNKITFGLKKTTTDQDILRRRWILIDIDPVRPSGVAATGREARAAVTLSRSVRESLQSRGWPEPIRVASGNGAYLIYRADLPNDEQATDLVRRFLRSLASEFDTDAATIDTSVYNAARVLKIAGTWNRKGDDLRGHEGIEDRPHRQSYYVVPDAAPEAVPRELIESVAGESPAATSSPPSPSTSSKATQGQVYRCQTYVDKIHPAIEGQGGSKKTLEVGATIARFGIDADSPDAWRIMQSYSARCLPPWSDTELRHKLDDGHKKAVEAGEWHTKGQHSDNKPGVEQDDPNAEPPESAAETLSSLLDRLRRREGDKLFSAGEAFKGFEWGPKKITVLGAPPGAGKTAMVMQIVMEAMTADNDLHVYMANAEMPFEVLLRRELSRRSGVPGKALRFADLTELQMESVESAAAEIKPMMERVEAMSPPFTIERLSRLLGDRKPGVVVVDYLQKFAAAEHDPRQGCNVVVAGLRELAFAGWGVMAISATSRSKNKNGSGHDGGSLTMASFKESGEIEFNADSAYLIRDEGPTEEGCQKIRNVVVDCVKNRHGESHRFELVFDMPNMKFREREPEKHDFGVYGDNPFSAPKNDNLREQEQLFPKYDNVGAHN